jgi:hypothetical protein
MAAPLVPRWRSVEHGTIEAGAARTARVVVENAGTAPWRTRGLEEGLFLSYHWLDERGNPIVWDGMRTPLPPLAPGEAATVDAIVRAPVPPGSYRFALDLVAESRAWFSELGSPIADRDVAVVTRVASGTADLPAWVEPAPDWEERVAAAHAEGFGVVAGAIDWPRGALGRRPSALEPYRPGPGRVPSFSHPLLCPSIAAGVELERLPDVEGLPAFAAPPPQLEPWVWDGRIVLRAHPDRR